MASFPFELVSPDKLVFRGAVDDVLVPGSEGDFLVLVDHAPVMTTLRPGILDIGEGAKHTRLFVRGGFADVSPTGLIVLAETTIPVDELSADRIAGEIKNAEEDLADATEEQKQAAQEKVDRLRELKDALKI
ncbi:MAG TPA: F0F1 ATP synthase subunit epsilon [Roseiarcus sp.]|nr:F0F1 ATP synthase subunit epsilon [Roseiarcus sp.]